MRQLEFRILGPLDALTGERQVPLGAAKQRAVMAILLLHANEVVSTDRLIEDLWGAQPPPTAQTALQGYVSQLRKLLEPEHSKGAPHRLLQTQAAGYVLRLGRDRLDLHRFERLLEEGREALGVGRAKEAAAALREALALWRGPALADFTYEAFAQTAISRLEELRLAALELRIDADLALGRHAELVGELDALAREHPLRERLRGQLMLALYRAGRQAEALAAYQEGRRVLVEEFGIDPSPALQRLERDILMQDASLDLAAPAPASLPAGRVTLLFTDIEGSTLLLHELGERYAGVLGEHRRLLRAAFLAHGGHEVDRQGDGFFFVFVTAADAVGAAFECQRALAAHPWPEGAAVRVRMGIASGAPALIDGGYVGVDVHRAARICAAAHGGQVVLSEETVALLPAGELHEAGLRELGPHSLKGLSEPERLFQLVIEGLPSDFPPLRVSGEGAPLAPPDRSILVISDGAERLPELLALAEPLARSRQPHELIVARLLEPDRAGLLAGATAELQEQKAALESRRVVTRVAAFTSLERAVDIVRLASQPEVDLLLLSGREGLLRDGALGEELDALLGGALCDVAFWVKQGTIDGSSWLEGPVLVPFGADEHDWAALELGAWIASASGRPLRLLGTMAVPEEGKRDASRLLADAGLLIQRASGVVAQPRLVGPGREGVVEAANDGGLLVVGLSQRWAQEGLGMVRWAIAKTANAPVLFVRRGLRPGGLAPGRSMTRFTWSVSAPGR